MHPAEQGEPSAHVTQYCILPCRQQLVLKQRAQWEELKSCERLQDRAQLRQVGPADSGLGFRVHPAAPSGTQWQLGRGMELACTAGAVTTARGKCVPRVCRTGLSLARCTLHTVPSGDCLV